MPINPRVKKAFRAMKSIGISEEKVKPILKNLLKLYDKNWELIEEENYRALADAIFEKEEAEAAEHRKPENHEVGDVVWLHVFKLSLPVISIGCDFFSFPISLVSFIDPAGA